MAEAKGDNEGWSPTRGRKWHFFGPDGRSLCGRWGFNFATREAGNPDSPDNCVVCRRRLAKREEARHGR
jgi:hypothetical protein